jgi:tRNA pseudouridine32 synthase/23S rRNA pseudouridine746 synthase
MDATVASRLQLPPGRWPTLLDGLCARFPAIAREVWLDRFARGRVTDAEGVALPADAAYRPGLELRYFREVVDEPVIPGDELVLHVDAHLVVVDKPHFLPVTPSGAFVRECLLRRLVARLGQADLAPMQRLFRERSIRKVYEAVAPAVPNTAFPQVRATRLQRGEPFFRMAEVAGEANSETRIAVLERAAMWWRYALTPITGRKHQLRVHMAAIGAPLRNDRWYPEVCAEAADDYSRPLQLLARSLDFVDPLSGATRRFTSARELLPLA